MANGNKYAILSAILVIYKNFNLILIEIIQVQKKGAKWIAFL